MHVPAGSRRRLRAADVGYAAGIGGGGSGRDDGVAGGGAETAYLVREAPGQRERVRAFRFGHRLATVAVRRLLDLGMEAVARGLLPAHPEGQGQPRSPGEGGTSS